METRETLVAAALKVLEEDGEAQFSTRAVCTRAKVTAPTLYHHFGSADGLLSAAISEAFRQFLESKRAAATSSDPETALRQGWDDYVQFAAARPRLFAAMLSRYLGGAVLPAAEEGLALLVAKIQAIADAGRLGAPVQTAADLTWASANAAALLFVTAQQRLSQRPDPSVIEHLREQTMQAILTTKQRARKP